MSSHRIKQVNELIRNELSTILLREITTPSGSFLTVTTVNTSKDLNHATVLISVLHAKNKDKILEMLNKKAGYLTSLLAEKIILKRVPRLHFKYDLKEEKAIHINELIDKNQQER